MVVTRLARGRHMRPPLRTGVPLPAGTTVSAVIPARDEAGRIGPCVIAARADPGISEVIVVDDESTDGTAAVAARAGARVIPGLPLPPGWVGKQWALQQGLEVASGEYVLTLDADARPRPGLAAALVRAAGGGPFDLVSAGPRFVCDSPAEQGLHAAMLATLVYRFGPIGPARQPRPHRVVVNGQCLLARRAALAAAGGFTPVRAHLTDDIALARDLARRGWRIGFLDGRDLLDVDMHASVAEVWREWGRSLPMADVASPASQAADLAMLGLTTALPLARLAAGRPTALDLGLLAMRASLLIPLRGCYTSPGPGLYLSPLADVAALIRMAGGTIRPVRSWRGRRYPVSPAASVRQAPVPSSRPAGGAAGGRALPVPRGERGHPEPHPDERHQRARGRHLQGRGEDQLQERNREHAGPRADREGSREERHRGAERDAQAEGGRADDREPTGEGEHAAAAAQPGEDRPGVADHGRRDGRVHQGHAPGPAARGRVPGGAGHKTPCASIRPSSPAAVPFSVSPASTGRAPAQPSWSFMFQKPGFLSPTPRGSSPRARPTSTATGMEPRR